MKEAHTVAMSLRTANIIGSGPNGLAAAITLAQAGVAVTVFERNERIGGACSTAELTLPGFRHDLGSSVYPLGFASPVFRSLPLHRFGMEWIHPPAAVAHPLDDGTAVLLEHSVDATVAQFSSDDQRAWRALVAPSVRDWGSLVDDFLRGVLHFPRHPVQLANFGSIALLPAQGLAKAIFSGVRARAVLAGCAAHAVIPLTNLSSSATGLVFLTAAHTTGWPIVRGGAGELTRALAELLQSLGGRIETGTNILSLAQLPPADVTLFDTSAQSMVQLSGDALSSGFRTRLRHTRMGPGIFKIDYALRQPIPWSDPACLRTATVHLGGTLPEIAASEDDAFKGKLNDRPFVLLTQPSLFDPSRAPRDASGRQQHTAWAYCHVPQGCTLDRTDVIEAQIERFAPGFRDCVLARRTWNAGELEHWNPNLVGGDISGGAMTLAGLIARPTLRQWRTSNPRLYLASSAAPPGGGVHGMAGYMAALAALADHR
jgi:phytoene dehydrogenase-like protein